jgi:hypothetical protein
MPSQADNSGILLHNDPANVAQHSLTVKDLGDLGEIERLGNAATLTTAKKLAGEIEAHNATVAKFQADIAASHLGKIEGDAVKFANGLRQRRIEIAHNRLRLQTERVQLKAGIQADHLEYANRQRKILEDKRQEAKLFATGIFNKDHDYKIKAEIENRLLEDAAAACEFRPRILIEFSLADTPDAAIGIARQQLAHAITAAAGLSDAYGIRGYDDWPLVGHPGFNDAEQFDLPPFGKSRVAQIVKKH